MTATSTSVPCHELDWDPYTAYEFVTVGTEMNVCFWLMEESAGKHELKVSTACIAFFPDHSRVYLAVFSGA